jgi:O-antigen ligase
VTARHFIRITVVPAFLLLCLALGGASGGGHLANLVLQLSAIPIVIAALAARPGAPMPRPGRVLVTLLVLAVALVLVQLVPLPPRIWTNLPGRDWVAQGFEMLGQPLPWMPISLAPERTVSSALWALPAVAVLLGMLRLGGFRPAMLAWMLVFVTAVAVGLGALQLAGGESSPLYFYEIANRGMATGFFANSNNMAQLLVITIPFVGALYLRAREGSRSVQKSSGLLVVLAGALTILLVGIAVNGSLAGIGLAVAASLATALMLAFRRRPLPAWAASVGALLLIGAAATVVMTPLQTSLLAEEAQRGEESRAALFRDGLRVATDYMPLGSGVGTFAEIYPRYENVASVTRWYLNHAHNDYIELAVETGVPGTILIGLFLLWWGGRAVAIWRADTPDHFARAATIATASLLAHSMVEFPLRTAALSAVLAMCCALMAEARGRSGERRRRHKEEARHLSAD